MKEQNFIIKCSALKTPINGNKKWSKSMLGKIDRKIDKNKKSKEAEKPKYCK